MTRFLIYSIPAAIINSSLEFMTKELALFFRENLTIYFHTKYLKGNVLYQITNLDTRIANPDNILTTTIEKWSSLLSNSYLNIFKPLFEILIFSYKLANSLGSAAPIIMASWYVIVGKVISKITRQYSQLVVNQQKLEGEYKAIHSSIVNYSEEIAFYRGNKFEKRSIDKIFHKLIHNNLDILEKKFKIDLIENLLGKFCSVNLGYLILGLPNFFSNLNKSNSLILKEYVGNVSLLVNLSKAIGKILISFKDVQNLFDFGNYITKFDDTIIDVFNNHFVNKNINRDKKLIQDKKYRGGTFEIEDYIEFIDVSVITPNYDVLFEKLNFIVLPGQNTIITGPNGVGKSTIFRILRNLWPLKSGVIKKPFYKDIFYIPQRPYLPLGTLRDQIIYPTLYEDFLLENHNDSEIFKLFELINLNNLLKRSHFNLDTIKNWDDILSGGEKQRVVFARLLFHRPKYAILDEATSAVSVEMEGKLYKLAKNMRITLLTVSHRKTLRKYHEYNLQLDFNNKFTFQKINNYGLDLE